MLVELTLIQVAQITQKEDDIPASGRSPKRLKSLFKNLILKAQQKPTPQVVGSLKRDDNDTARGSNDVGTVSVEVVSSSVKAITETSVERFLRKDIVISSEVCEPRLIVNSRSII